MHTRLAEIVGFLGRTRVDLDNSFAGATRDQLAKKPSPSKWSVAEILDHLGIVEAGIAGLIAKLVGRGKAEGIPREASETSLLGTFDAFSFPNTRHAFDAPARVAPRAGPDPDEVRDNLRRSREELRAALQSADGMDLSKLSYNHVILGPLDLYQWAMFVGQHEARHTAQIKRTLKEIG
ncbi:MAG: DinB family protein [Gemmatimonadota bacterium]|nr:DinB family protein [Gemmatimonadota bacterium]